MTGCPVEVIRFTMKDKLVTGRDIDVIYDALLFLTGNEGCTILETLTEVSDSYTAKRIYDEVFV